MDKVTSGAVVRVGEHGWWRVTAVATVVLVLALPNLAQAATFQCGAGDVPCLIAAINDANANGHRNTIRLEAGTYTLTDVDNDTDGANGLPSITSHLMMKGAGADTTSVARASSAPGFRLIHVGTSGHLTVDGVTLTGGGSSGSGGGLFNNGGVVNITRSTFANNFGVATGGLSTGVRDAGGTVLITDSRFTGDSRPGRHHVEIGNRWYRRHLRTNQIDDRSSGRPCAGWCVGGSLETMKTVE